MTILVVEDYASFLSALLRLLATYPGVNTISTNNLEVAKWVYKTLEKPDGPGLRVDVVLCDGDTGGPGRGADWAVELKNSGQDAVIMSGADYNFRPNVPFLLKPFDGDKLAKALGLTNNPPSSS